MKGRPLKIGILGAGQLGRMMALAAYPLGLSCLFYDRTADTPGGQVGPIVTGAFDDAAALEQFARQVDVVTYDWENVPVAAARSVVQLADARAGKRTAHWQAVAVAACEQCGRNRVPEVTAPMGLVEACRLAAADPGTRLWALDAEGGTPLAAALPSRNERIALLVGPEGGLSDEELETAALIGFSRLRLGPRVLRTETAGPAALAALQALAGDFGD